jgi:hypothetical protein
MAIKMDWSKVNIKPPSWSGGKKTCPSCNSNERCSSVGGFYYEDSILKMRDWTFCFKCNYNKKIGNWP